jgi:acetyl-CoA synthetase
MNGEGIGSYADLVSRAAADPAWFYPAAMDFLDLEWMTPWTQLRDESDGIAHARWFVGGGSNLAWLATSPKRADSEVAIIWEGDDGEVREVSSGDLRITVRRLARGLRSIGITKGDVVTIHLPMIPEAVMALLAVASVGAIASPSFSGYGVEALAERIELGGSKLVITADGLLRRGKSIPMAPIAFAASMRASSRPQVVVVPRLGGQSTGSSAAIMWEELLRQGQDERFDVFDAQDPWLLAFTSGSTGRPKGVVHTHGGMPYGAGIEMAFAFDVRQGDRMCWPSDMGWIIGPLCTVVPLSLGASIVLFEGVADFPEPDRLWQIVDKHHVSHLGLAPTTARILAQSGDSYVDGHALESLRIIGSSGEPWTVPAWRWLHRHAGRGRAPIINWAGGTEIGGGILAGSPAVVTQSGRFSGPSVGMDVDVVDPEGISVVDQVGELVVRRSWPSMTRGFWREPERYLESYWSKIPDVWVHGDRAIHFSDGSWELPGRSDDVMKIAGKRVGPAEFESLALENPGVALAGAVGVPDPTKGELCVVVVTRNPTGDFGDIAVQVENRITSAMGRAMKPRAVLVVDSLPLTRSGKVHRRALRSWLSGVTSGDLSSLDNPECETSIRRAGKALLEDHDVGDKGPLKSAQSL